MGRYCYLLLLLPVTVPAVWYSRTISILCIGRIEFLLSNSLPPLAIKKEVSSAQLMGSRPALQKFLCWSLCPRNPV